MIELLFLRGTKATAGSRRSRASSRQNRMRSWSGCQRARASGAGRGRGGLPGVQPSAVRQGARSVVLSLCPVDDGATALLMQRFYANLLGKRPGLDRPMPEAEALAEAKAWLRELGAWDAEEALQGLQAASSGRPKRRRPRVPRGRSRAHFTGRRSWGSGPSINRYWQRPAVIRVPGAPPRSVLRVRWGK